MSGQINVALGGVEMVAGPQWSWDLVEELRLTLRRVVETRPADPDAVVAGTSPELAEQARVATSGWSRSDKLSLYTLILVAITADYSNVATVAAAVQALFHHVMTTGKLPGS
ncbi:hypothetical protein [Nocardioides bruguierae]|uniref:Uncharacterized protein n=1 Tax=Nocardioides bruguierae TaxID=2945102 RepID=A0A9X2IG50_9ACTN|nr:hypothetical protein [Nocardioides bruguierae]MCM0622521.1 hypothetical protein [Nocardioides bruguierae]